MALRPLNALDGLSVSENSIQIVFANGHVAAASLAVTGTTNLGAVGNVTITGGTSGQVLSTDGAGNLSFTTVSSGGGGQMPYYIPSGETYTVEENKQGLFTIPITIDGDLVVNGILAQVS
jgi:hypothetical protein